ncbi:MAG: tetratricopeptide (TPR) repeat protein [Akkermansiaceae bacterium]|jgi:tetratricopeptide (TPR) repeat protein
MSDTPHDIQFALSEFDRSELPESQRELQGDDFLQAVQAHLAAQFSGQGGVANVTVTKDRVTIRWKESTEGLSATEQGANHLKEGNYEKGIGILRRVLERNPDDTDALFNLGIALGDRQVADEALELLNRLVILEPNYPGAWVALGVVQARLDDWEQAIQTFREAVARDSQDGLARKNLGAALSQKGKLDEASEHLKAAVVLLPSDAEAWLNLAMHLRQSGESEEEGVAYKRVVSLAPGSHLSDEAEKGISRITNENFRKVGGDLNPDAVNFCSKALRLFDGMPQEEVQKIAFEIATLGSKGLSVNDSTEKYALRSLPGNFSGLHLLCIQYVGFKIIDPSADIGFDLAAEYEEAQRREGIRES